MGYNWIRTGARLKVDHHSVQFHRVAAAHRTQVSLDVDWPADLVITASCVEDGREWAWAIWRGKSKLFSGTSVSEHGARGQVRRRLVTLVADTIAKAAIKALVESITADRLKDGWSAGKLPPAPHDDPRPTSWSREGTA